jgi:transcriptional regulator
MYEPPLHRQDDLSLQHALIAACPLGLLITAGPQGLVANSIPFLIDRERSKFGTLMAHMARANGQWRDLKEVSEALVVFQGPDHYISPSWYATKRETGKVVPTWNYVMVQARGRPEVIEDDSWLAGQIEMLTRAQEGGRAKPWAVGDAPADFIAMQRKAIIGLEIEIVDLRGKWKASQNRPAADRAGVVAGLGEEDDATAGPMAEIVLAARRD